MSKIHLITTCSKSKNGECLETLQLSDFISIDEAHQVWKKRINARFEDRSCITETRNLYRGSHWNTALRISESRSDIVLWVISAGIGLRHSSDLAVPYEASFKDMPGLSSRFWELTIKNPILPGRMPSLEALLQANKFDRFVVAASPVYLNAVDNDLLRGINCLPDARAQITIVTTQGYRERLKPYLRIGTKSMMRLLNSNMTMLNIKHAEDIISSMPEVSEPTALTSF